MQRNYELVVVLSPELTSTQGKQAESTITQFVKDAKGSVVNVDNWGKKHFAYKIRKFEEGTYLVFTLELEPQTASELDKAVKNIPGVLRHMIVLVEPEKETKEKKTAPKAEK